ncbi:hypothetical protein LCER1_G005556 [Lachnellula cervina]|uniref:Uncharacterized protein n=1 Tax=Lachnellula cervina TaxID=1316786 RepID=A0A7D8YZ68_9HELO|nr:hypothetical protein LCER1_G005556 [Lachnellula cervina]
MAEAKELNSSLTKLSLDPQPSKSSKSFKQKQQTLADSWEDEASGDDTDRPLSPQQSADYPDAPPPTPISPSHSYSRESAFTSPYGYSASDTRPERSGSGGAGSRPEKTDAVAKRMIAGALGVKAPKKTEEQRAYEKAVKEKEVKRRNQEKEAAARAKDQAEKAKAAIWED